MPNYVDPDAVVKFVFPDDEGQENPPKFLLRVPSLAEEERVFDLAMSAERVRAATTEESGEDVEGEDAPMRIVFSSELVRAALGSYWVGVEDWYKPDGTPVEFLANKSGGASDRMMQTLAVSRRVALAARCLSVGRDVPETDSDS